MNRRIWVLLIIAVLAIGTVSAVSYRKVKDPFLGAWESTDVDGSHQYLWVLYNVEGAHLGFYYDDGASVCGDQQCVVGPPLVGVQSGRRVGDWGLSEDSFTGYCLRDDVAEWWNGYSSESVDATYTYDPDTDELFYTVYDIECLSGADVEVRWNRIGLGTIKQILK
jgi:hypothetical protein